MRVVFMGTPAFAVPTLEALHRAGHEIALVITQPDRPVGRGQRLAPPPVKVRAVELGLTVLQPARVKAPEVVATLQRMQPRAVVVVGYGQLIPRSIIDLPPLGCVNVHASLLPKYRGAAPINWAIANGETVTGVTTMLIEERLDAGDMLLRRETAIDPAETAPKLAARLAPMGAELLVETLAGLEQGTIVPEKQNEAEASYAPLLKREDGWIDWTLSAEQIFNRLRGFDPWPGAYTSFRGKRLHIRGARPLRDLAAGGEPAAKPGALLVSEQGLRVVCGGGTVLATDEVQLEGKKRVSADDFVRGYRPGPNEILGETPL